jgi:hypothetical protein
MWTTQVADKFKIDKATLDAVYDPRNPVPYDNRMRSMWKYSVARTITTTPSAVVNGNIL